MNNAVEALSATPSKDACQIDSSEPVANEFQALLNHAAPSAFAGAATAPTPRPYGLRRR
jgi:hypothetical protein